MDEVDPPNPELRGLFRLQAASIAVAVEDQETAGSGDTVADGAVGTLEAVGEGKEEAGDAAEGEEGGGHEAAGSGAPALVGEDGRQQLEGQQRSRR